jgi:hypothetical protein
VDAALRRAVRSAVFALPSACRDSPLTPELFAVVPESASAGIATATAITSASIVTTALRLITAILRILFGPCR